jgi:GNAT superfamily N-acetyltransferase
MISRTSLNKTRISQWLDIMRQLRPSVAAEAVDELIPWRYKFITASRDNRIVGVGTYYPTASLIRGKFHYIADLVVDSKYQGKGVGTEMMREIVDPTISYELDSGLERIDAHHFYLSHGFLHTGYAVRPPVAVLMSIENLPQQLTYHIDGSQHLEAQGKNKLDQIQAFIDEHAGMNSAYQANLQLFMINNSEHRLLLLQNESGELEGLLLYELQNRLCYGGNCFHVTDFIVKGGLGAAQRQEALLLSLLQQAKKTNLQDHFIKTIVVEMPEEDVQKHNILKSSRPITPHKDSISSNGKININSFLSVSAKHFVKVPPPSDKDKSRAESWYQKRSPQLS